VLRACRRVLKTGGLISFLVIAVADRLSAAETLTAIEAGPEQVAAESGYSMLMDAAGFEDVDVIDVTDEYLVTLSAWLRAWEAESTEIQRLIGVDQFAERQTSRRQALEKATDGLLRRYLISAIRP